MADIIITREYLITHPNEIFVFGDNLLEIGKGGAAALRDLPNTYGFVTKRYPGSTDKDYYTPYTYYPVFYKELGKLIETIMITTKCTFLISKLGSGLANRFGIYEEVIKDNIKILNKYPNVTFLYED
jgi:hypothetical protein